VKVPVLNANDEGYRATLAADGKILITGFSDNGVDADLVVVRFSYDGVLDTSFGVGGKASVSLGGNDYGYAITTLPNGKILVAGRSGNDIALVRLLGDSDQSAAASNKSPVNSVPGSQAATSNLPYAFTAYRGNQISISDPDAGGNQVQVTLSVNTGSLTLLNPDPGGGLTYSAGDGTSDSTMTFTGTTVDVNSTSAGAGVRTAKATPPLMGPCTVAPRDSEKLVCSAVRLAAVICWLADATAAWPKLAALPAKKAEAVRRRLARPSLSPRADSRATRWTAAVDTPASSRPR
jgi:hypothetical protein